MLYMEMFDVEYRIQQLLDWIASENFIVKNWAACRAQKIYPERVTLALKKCNFITVLPSHELQKKFVSTGSVYP